MFHGDLSPNLGFHVQTEAGLVCVHLLLQLPLGHFQLCHLAGHPLLVQFLLMLPLNLLILNQVDFGFTYC